MSFVVGSMTPVLTMNSHTVVKWIYTHTESCHSIEVRQKPGFQLLSVTIITVYNFEIISKYKVKPNNPSSLLWPSRSLPLPSSSPDTISSSPRILFPFSQHTKLLPASGYVPTVAFILNSSPLLRSQGDSIFIFSKTSFHPPPSSSLMAPVLNFSIKTLRSLQFGGLLNVCLLQWPGAS